MLVTFALAALTLIGGGTTDASRALVLDAIGETSPATVQVSDTDIVLNGGQVDINTFAEDSPLVGVALTIAGNLVGPDAVLIYEVQEDYIVIGAVSTGPEEYYIGIDIDKRTGQVFPLTIVFP
jgi:hypothetical protein